MSNNPFQEIQSAILNRFPMAEFAVDPSETVAGSWFLNVALGNYSLVVEWNPQQGIGVTTNPEMGYGEGAEEVFHDAADAQERILELLLSKTRTVPPTATLSEIRKERRLTQTQLAGSLSIQQASIAKMEKRSDFLVSTLQAIISAMGGRLLIRAVFPDGMERELSFSQAVDRESPRTQGT
jgi:DNA-binding XRE family transcriptional regulator